MSGRESKGTRVAVVTGGASGIGAATIAALQRDGYLTASLDWAGGEQISKKGLSITTDVCDSQSVERAVARVLASYGRIDVLVNCAGLGVTSAFVETTISDWNRVIAVNLTGTFLVTQSVARWMVGVGSGVIVNVGSTATALGTPGQSAYAASKGAVHALSRSLASELGPHGIRVNTVVPGPTHTLLAARMQTDTAQQRRAERTPDGRLGMPEEVASAILFLASELSSHISGAELTVDGGFSVAGILDA